MKKVILLLFVVSFPVLAQFNPSDFAGTYSGTWFNNTFQSTGAASLIVNINQANMTIELILDLDGNVFGGTDPETATMNGGYDNNGFNATGNSPTYGPMFFDGNDEGEMNGRLPDVPAGFIDSTILDGTYNPTNINLTYEVYFGGSSFADGVINMVKESTSADDENVQSLSFSLYQNYPNPFNPSTTMKFSIPKESFTKLEIFNALGEKVSTLVSENLSAGTYEYEWNAEGLPSGIYFYRLSAENFVQTKKLLLIK
jgi:hypothetical protein